MIHSRALILFACALFAAEFATGAHADDCKLGRIASIDFTEDGAIIVPVSMERTSLPMAIDTGAEVSAVDPVIAGRLNLITHRIVQGSMYDSVGEQFTQFAIVHSFGVGEMKASEVKMLVWPSRMTSDGRLGGVLGADLLRHYDVDIDFSTRKLSLFSQDHCPGKVVYWSADNIAVIPMHVVNSGHVIVPITLDGRPFDAVLDTGSTFSHISMEAAHNAFGLTANSPDMTKTGDVNGVVQSKMYRHTFKSLGLEGLAIGNPTLYILENLVKYSTTQAAHTGSRLSDANESGGITDVILGLNELRHLHVYIAYNEQKLYISPAAAAVAVPAPAAASATTTAAH